jgi:predicted nucleic acid-binding Zn finger protein
MTDTWQHLPEINTLDSSFRHTIEMRFGSRGKKALAAIDAGKIKKYLDFFVVEGRTAEYITEDDFCTCGDFLYRGRTCWHLLAVRIAKETGTFVRIEGWYQDRWNTTAQTIP